jgi:hypothetical protein
MALLPIMRWGIKASFVKNIGMPLGNWGIKKKCSSLRSLKNWMIAWK